MIWAVIAAYALVGVGFSRQAIFMMSRHSKRNHDPFWGDWGPLPIFVPILVTAMWPVFAFVLVFRKPLQGFWNWFVTDPQTRKKVRA